MLAIPPPLCPQTSVPAVLFCCTRSCPLPAFGCDEMCLQSHPPTHERCLWSVISHAFHRKPVMTQPHLRTLQQQDKLLLVIIGQLNQLQKKHSRAVHECRSRLRVNFYVTKVEEALRNGTTVNGGDMYNLMKVLAEDKYNTNVMTVETGIKQRNEMVEVLIKDINDRISEFKGSYEALGLPNHWMRIPPLIDDLKRDKKIKVTKQYFTIKDTGFLQVENQHPVGLKQCLEDGWFFEVEVVDLAGGRFLIGVSPEDAETIPLWGADIKGVVGYHARGGLLVKGGERTITKHAEECLKNGDVVMVRRIGQELEWIRDGQVLCKATIPAELAKARLYPVCWLVSYRKEQLISKLKYL